MSSAVRVCGVGDVEPGTARRFDLPGHRIAIVRIGDDFYAIGDRCSHANVSLAEGEVDSDQLEIECWRHGSTFSLVTGKPQSLPATKSIPVYEVSVSGADVMVVLG